MVAKLPKASCWLGERFICTKLSFTLLASSLHGASFEMAPCNIFARYKKDESEYYHAAVFYLLKPIERKWKIIGLIGCDLNNYLDFPYVDIWYMS